MEAGMTKCGDIQFDITDEVGDEQHLRDIYNAACNKILNDLINPDDRVLCEQILE